MLNIYWYHLFIYSFIHILQEAAKKQEIIELITGVSDISAIVMSQKAPGEKSLVILKKNIGKIGFINIINRALKEIFHIWSCFEIKMNPNDTLDTLLSRVYTCQ